MPCMARISVSKTIDLPYLVEAWDYHEFENMQLSLREDYITDKIVVEEIGCTKHLPPGANYYIGIVFSEKDNHYYELINRVTRECKIS